MNAKPEAQSTTFTEASKLHNDCISSFKMIRAENFDIIVGNLNINSISPKFDEFKLMVSGNFDAVILVTEIKLDDSFLKAQFCMDGFSICWKCQQ